MSILPLIVGLGGINSAGRSSGLHSYKRMLADALTDNQMANTWLDLNQRMHAGSDQSLDQQTIAAIKQGTLIRKIKSFNPDQVRINRKAKLDGAFTMRKSDLPNNIPAHWQITELNEREVKVTALDEELLVPTNASLGVSCGADIPDGFDPANLYNARNHPLGVRMAVYGASDAINSLGFAWDDVLEHIEPDQVSVYAGNACPQVDDLSLAGLIKQPLLGHRVSSKMLALSLPEMAADFINSYIIGSVGTTGSNIGACASFLYNLRQGAMDIKAGKAQVAIVGNADAPLTPPIIDGFRSMGALATDAGLQALDGTATVDYARACRPFSTNCGFTIGNSAQFVVLMAPELALKLGANIYGSVADVFINADANKKSISAPGIGNYITFAKATALAQAILGEQNLRQTFVQAHGTGTPQNRVTESHIINEVAKTFGLNDWAVTSIKPYVGHSFGAAAGDQLMSTLGSWQYNWVPGIKTIDHIADDVANSHLNFLQDHLDISNSKTRAALINSKGFGGNNASALILSPSTTEEILTSKFTGKQMQAYHQQNERVKQQASATDHNTCQGQETLTYRFGEAVMGPEDISMTTDRINLSQFKTDIKIKMENPYK